MDDMITKDDRCPLISVIVPVYNEEKYLRRCIDCILSQDYENLELVLMDDGSDDGSAAICESYAASDLRCRFFSQNNSGPDITRREGFLKSAGEYVVFVDADDYILPRMISTLYASALEYKAPIVCCEIDRFFDDGSLKSESRTVDRIEVFETTVDKMQAFFERRVLQGSYCAKLIKREILEGYSFVTDTVIGEDISAILYLLEQDGPVVLLPDAFYRYYWNLESISHSAYTDRHKYSLKNYISRSGEMVDKHYLADSAVYGFFAEREMAVATAMSRGKTYDPEAATMLRDHIVSHWADIKSNRYTPAYMKACMLIYMLCPRLFIAMYRVVYRMTGR